MVAFFLGLDQARRAIHERRHHLEADADVIAADAVGGTALPHAAE